MSKNEDPGAYVERRDLVRDVTNTLEANFKPIIIAVVGVLVIGGGYIGYGQYQNRLEAQAQEELYHLSSSLEKKQQEIYESHFPSEEDFDMDAPLPDMPLRTKDTLVDNFGSLVSQFESFIGDHSGRKAASTAAIELSDLYLEHGMGEEAVGTLTRVMKDLSQRDFFFGLVAAQKAVALSNIGQCDKAIGVYDQILSVEAHAHMHPQVSLRKGACFIEMKDFSAARDELDRVTSEYPDSGASETARGLKRLLILKEGEVQS